METLVRDRQQDYYDALARSDEQAEGTLFVEFMIEALSDALEQALAEDGGVSGGVSGGVKSKLDALDRQILAHCRDTPQITQAGLVSLTGKPLRTIQRRIQKLRKGYLRRVGSDKAGHWEVIGD